MPAILPHITLETGPAPRHSIIWLHGLGADGNDFVPVAEEMTLPVPVRYLFPHAPMRPVTINGGYVMRAWYDILATAPSGEIADNLGRMEDEAGIRQSQQEIEQLIAQERARGIEAGHIILAGFSQGGAIALHCGLRHAEKLGGILALSTYLPLRQTLEVEAAAANRNIPLFMAHGQFDTVIPYPFGQASAQAMRQLGYEVEWHGYAMPHSVCEEEITDIARWLGDRLAG
jgi:phospholipase/carboxylesterase